MSLYVGDSDVALPFVFTLTTITGTDVTSITLRYESGQGEREWTLTPSASTATTVSTTRVIAAPDLPTPAPLGYPMRAWFYGAGAVLLGSSDEFRGPPVRPSIVSPP